MYKFFAVAAVLATANAGLLAPALAPAAVTSQSQNILRSWGNLGQVSTYSKTIDTPWSSVSKSDIRVSNPGVASVGLASPLLAQRTIGLGSPLLAQQTIASPLLAQRTIGLGSPLLAQRTIGLGSPLLAQQTIASPLLAQRTIGLGSPLLAQQTIASPLLAQRTIGLGSPLLAQRTIGLGSPLLAQRTIAAPTLIGTAYSAAPAVSHVSVEGLGLSYGW